VAYAEETGFDQLVERGTRSTAGLPERIVYAGSSLGAKPAQKLAQTRDGRSPVVRRIIPTAC
jgi:hypothetical protein